ncbi:MAG: DUF3131 domain-containing protein, partial [Halobacillus sp.]|uniref:DUF3131 domain-containing protein n=1 Tax=Halobacillus sp. TaxID=56800 RepID=UPI003BB06771
MKKYCMLFLVLILTVVTALPGSIHAAPKGKKIALSKQLEAISKKTYRYFEDFTIEDTGLTYDAVRFDDDEMNADKHTSPTNIAMYMMSTISAEETGLISREESVERIHTTLNTLEDMKKWNGL